MYFRVQYFSMSLTWLEKAFAVSVQRNDQNATLHVIVALDAHFRQRKLRIPAIVFRIDAVPTWKGNITAQIST